MEFLIVILGPTASGKTELAIRLAEWLGTEIISADSRQFYREMKIGTARPDKEQMDRVKHHFAGHVSVLEPYNIARYEREVLDLLPDLFQKNRIVVLTGGSGLYIDAVCKGIDVMPEQDPLIRRELENIYRKSGIGYLQLELLKLDPDYYRMADLSNPARLIRALEVCRITGKPYSSFRKNEPSPRNFQCLKIGLDLPRQDIVERINRRVDSMMEAGLLDEVKSLLPLRYLNTLNTVGYKELFDHLDGNCTLEEAVENIKTNTRRYAKRQMTWFRKDASIRWFHPAKWEQIREYITRSCGL
ncbi:MAG: tRNA (adenosine(37)-N6)-dimethylallyltransferase MiaA [Bacteroidales bacterium]